MSCNSSTYAAGIATWGDSLTRGNGSSLTTRDNSYPGRLAALSSRWVFNGGIGGQTSTEVRSRLIAATDKYSRATIIWVGRNNPTAPATVLADVAAMVAALGHMRYLVLSVTGAELGAAEYAPSGATYLDIATINSGFSSAYGTRYVDVRSYLVSLYNPGVPQDVTDFGHDIPPSTLRSDTVHLNDAGYQAVANKVFEKIGVLFP